MINIKVKQIMLLGTNSLTFLPMLVAICSLKVTYLRRLEALFLLQIVQECNKKTTIWTLKRGRECKRQKRTDKRE